MKRHICIIGILLGVSLQDCDAGNAININFNNGADFIRPVDWIELQVSTLSDQDVSYPNVGGTGIDLVVDSGNGRTMNSAWDGWAQEVGFRTTDGDTIRCDISNIPYSRYKIIAHVGNADSPQSGSVTLKNTVSINFNNGADFIDVSQFQGVSGNSNWIEVLASTLSDQDVSYPNVGGTGIDLVVDSGNGRVKNSAWDGWAQEVGFRTNLDSDTIRCDIHNIPFSRYRIIAHVGNYGSPQAGMIALGDTTYYFSGSSVSPVPSLVESTDANDGDGVDAGSYVIFGKGSGWLTGSSQTITVSAISGISMLGAIEIIPDTPDTYYFSGSSVSPVPSLMQSMDTDSSDGIDVGSYVVFGDDETPLVGDRQTIRVKAISGVSMFDAVQIVPDVPGLGININFNNGVNFIEANHCAVELISTDWIELLVSAESDQDVSYMDLGGTGIDLVVDSGNGRTMNSAWDGWVQEVGFRTNLDDDLIRCDICDIPYTRYKIIAHVGNCGSPQTGSITLKNSVNINFNNGADFIDPSEFTGLSGNPNWIELQASTLSDQDVSYPNVGGTGIDLVVDSGNGRLKNSVWDGWAQEVGFRTNLDSDTIRCDIHNIPFSRYRIIAHVGNYGSPQAGRITSGDTTYYFSGSSVSPVPSLVESTDTNDVDGIDAGSYVIFGKGSGWLTGSSQTITVSAISGISMLGAIEIIPDMPETYYFSGSSVSPIPLLLQSTDTDNSDGIDAGSCVVFGDNENPLIGTTQTVTVNAISGISMFDAIQIVPEVRTLKLLPIQNQ